jgi:hypothetical protein
MDEGAFIVLVADEGDPEHAKTRILRSAEEAAGHVQVQVEAGIEPSRIRVFASTEMAIKVTFRPVVAIGDGAEDSDGQGESAASFSSMFKKA